jgi:hypothetical protein
MIFSFAFTGPVHLVEFWTFFLKDAPNGAFEQEKSSAA